MIESSILVWLFGFPQLVNFNNEVVHSIIAQLSVKPAPGLVLSGIDNTDTTLGAERTGWAESIKTVLVILSTVQQHSSTYVTV